MTPVAADWHDGQISFEERVFARLKAMLRIALRTMRPQWCHSSFETPLARLLWMRIRAPDAAQRH